MLSPRKTEQSEKQRQACGKPVADALNEAQGEGKSRQSAQKLRLKRALPQQGRSFARERLCANGAQELQDAFDAISAMRLPDDRIETRRWQKGAAEGRFDPQQTMRKAMRGGGTLYYRNGVKSALQPPL